MTETLTAAQQPLESGESLHPSTPLLARIARFSTRRPRLIVAIWLLLIVIAAPLKIVKGSGSPLRVIAITPA